MQKNVRWNFVINLITSFEACGFIKPGTVTSEIIRTAEKEGGCGDSLDRR
jgi:hypothetical protein